MNLNLERGHPRVERSLDTLYGPAVENDPKRASSRRSAVLLPPVVAALKTHRKRQAAEKLAAGPAWREHGYDFPTLDFRKLRKSH